MIVLWVRSFSSYRVIWGETNVMLLIAPTDAGRWATNKDRDDPKTETVRWNYLMRNCDKSAKVLGFELCRGREPSYGFPYWIIVARYGSLALLTAVLPAIWIFRVAWRRSRLEQTLCQVCNYDIRATPDRCPECGAVPETLPSQHH